MPSDYKQIVETTGKEEVLVKFPVPNAPPILMSLRALYPTRMTVLMMRFFHISQGDICKYWLQHKGKCLRWANCHFLHPNLEVFSKLAKTKMCQPPCEARGVCPFAHMPTELIPPSDFVAYDTTASDIMVLGTNAGSISVPGRYVMNTAGLKYWLDTDKKTLMNICSNAYCDRWMACYDIHLSCEYWEERPSTELPRHPYLIKFLTNGKHQQIQKKQQQQQHHQQQQQQRPLLAAGAPAVNSKAERPHQHSPTAAGTPGVNSNKTELSQAQTSRLVNDLLSPWHGQPTVEGSVEHIPQHVNQRRYAIQPPPGLGGISNGIAAVLDWNKKNNYEEEEEEEEEEEAEDNEEESGDARQTQNLDLMEYLKAPPSNIRFKEVGQAIPQMRHKWKACSERYRPLFEQLIQTGKFISICEEGSTVPRFLFNRHLRIGVGGSSDVFLALKYDDGMEIALKRISKTYEELDSSNDSESNMESGIPNGQLPVDKKFKTEIDFLKTRNTVMGLVRYFGHVILCSGSQNDRHDPLIEYYIALELMECNLKELVESWQKNNMIGRRPAHFLTCQYIIGSVLRTLGDLWRGHGGLVHRDIKPENILIDIMKQVKLIDFGIAKEVNSNTMGGNTTSVLSGTFKYAAPEQFLCKRAVLTSDLFSLGLVLYYLLTGQENWLPGATDALHEQTCLNEVIPWPHKLAAARHLLENLLMYEPNKRAWYNPNAERKKQCHENILRHPFFWSDRQATNFLVALGNLRRSDYPAELGRLEIIINSVLPGYE